MATEARRTVLVGDVHGCLDELEALLRVVGADPTSDEVILVGDLTAKGPDSRGVVQLCRERGLRAVLGNHDAKVLSLAEPAGLDPHPPASSTHQAVADALMPADWAYLRALPLVLEVPTENAIVVHGGLLPGVALTAQPRKYLLNLRSLTPDGQPSTRVKDGVPWASRWTGPEHVIFGHDAVRGLQRYVHATGLDTGCVYGRRLTALVLPERKLVSVPAARPYAPA
jgi:hypothetical protein